MLLSTKRDSCTNFAWITSPWYRKRPSEDANQWTKHGLSKGCKALHSCRVDDCDEVRHLECSKLSGEQEHLDNYLQRSTTNEEPVHVGLLGQALRILSR